MALLCIVLGFLPGFAWLFFYLREDPHPEPKRLIFLTFVAGAIAAVAAFALEVFANAQLGRWGTPPLLVRIGTLTPFTAFSFLVLAFIEEVTKFGGAYVAIHKNRDFDEPIDAMIYMVVAALGFATVENIGVLSGSIRETTLASTLFETVSFRFVGATLLHTLTSALIGYYWALGIRNFKDRKYLFLGIGLATVLHAIFNYFIISYGNVIYSVLFLIVVGLFTLGDFEKLKREKI